MAEVTLKRIEGSAADPRLNVLFVHGLGGDPVSTWCSKGGQDDGYFWPRWLAEDMEGLAVYSVGYPAEKTSWNSGWPIAEAAVSVLDELMSDHTLRASKNTPIVLVCHSLGGLIVKKLVLVANSDRGQEPRKGEFLDRIAGVVFLATPHGGSMMATIAGQFHWFVSDSMRDLKANDAALLDFSVSYRNYIADNSARIRHLVFYEKQGMLGGAKPVEPMSADPGIAGVRPVAINRDHLTICKLETRKDQVYESVLAFLEDDVLGPRLPTRDEKLDERLGNIEALMSKIAFEKGVEAAPLRAVLEKLDEKGVRDEDIPNRLEAKADELVKLRAENDLLKEGPMQVAAIAGEAQALLDKGEFDAARAALARGREAARELREESSRYEAQLLAQEARVDHLQLAYRSAAAKYAEAASLVDSFDTESRKKMLFAQAGEFYAQGSEFGDNAALADAVSLYSKCLDIMPRERVPLDWAMTQNNLGDALGSLGERESGTARLEDAVAAYRAALEEWTRERAPLDWAMTQNNLGTALWTRGARESGTARLEEAVAAYRAALEERTRARVPLDWAMTQNNLGTALSTLGGRESGTARLEEAVAAYRAALEEWTRERVPLGWAMTQNNLGTALSTLGERESGTARLEEAVAAYCAALEERTRARVPLDWAMTQNNLGTALRTLGERESGTARLEEAVAAYRAALEERTRARVPLQWAMTQSNLGTALWTLGARESGTARLEEAVAAYCAALEEQTREAAPRWHDIGQQNMARCLASLEQRRKP